MKIELKITKSTIYNRKIKNLLLVCPTHKGCICSTNASCFLLNKYSQDAFVSEVANYVDIFLHEVQRNFYRRMKFNLDKI